MTESAVVSRHERRRQQSRRLLADAALQLVLEKGYDSISVQDITERADLGRGTFYLHFKDKEEAVWESFRELFGRMEQEAHRTLERSIPQVEYYGLLNIFRHAEKNRDLYRVLFGGQGSAVLTARAQVFLADAILHDIRSAPAAPSPNFNIPEEVEAQILTGAISRLLSWWLEQPNPFSADQMAAMTYQVFYRQEAPV